MESEILLHVSEIEPYKEACSSDGSLVQLTSIGPVNDHSLCWATVRYESAFALISLGQAIERAKFIKSPAKVD